MSGPYTFSLTPEFGDGAVRIALPDDSFFMTADFGSTARAEAFLAWATEKTLHGDLTVHPADAQEAAALLADRIDPPGEMRTRYGDIGLIAAWCRDQFPDGKEHPRHRVEHSALKAMSDLELLESLVGFIEREVVPGTQVTSDVLGELRQRLITREMHTDRDAEPTELKSTDEPPRYIIRASDGSYVICERSGEASESAWIWRDLCSFDDWRGTEDAEFVLAALERYEGRA